MDSYVDKHGLPHGARRAFTMIMRHHPPSPCTSICRIDPASKWCEGCRRTLTEIADWPMLTATEKRAVLSSLPQRIGAA
ncbi:DUF1289 domain-containing protein [Novosphingobium sp.]|uniref:DUF1289 domain-containing protein n=1 Tax=Novosphingobium sp. TaxID=1874826 RepID=UPI00286DC6E3|nr:DUF1289 domain-containing protein [Novosphingobium sp.]